MRIELLTMTHLPKSDKGSNAHPDKLREGLSMRRTKDDIDDKLAVSVQARISEKKVQGRGSVTAGRTFHSFMLSSDLFTLCSSLATTCWLPLMCGGWSITLVSSGD
jgi:hypothetical protein